MLRGIFGPKRDTLYPLLSSIRMIKSRIGWDRHVARMEEKRSAYKVMVRDTEEKRLLGRPRRRWEDNIKMDLK
jgi:hypothetical protein